MGGYIVLSPNGNSYMGILAHEVLSIFIKKDIALFSDQKSILDECVKLNKAKLIS